MDTPYRSKDACSVCGIPTNTMNQLLQRRIARPSIPGVGRGNPAQWSEFNIIALMLTKKLQKEARIELSFAADLADEMLNYASLLDATPDVDSKKMIVGINLTTLKWSGIGTMIKNIGDDIIITMDIRAFVNKAEQTIKEKLR